METSTESTSATITENTPLSAITTETPATSSTLNLLIDQLIQCGNTELREKVYIDSTTNYVKLFKGDIELTVGITNAVRAFLYDNEHWAYIDPDDFVHLYKDSIELTKEIKTLGVLRHPQTGQWFYADAKNRLLPIPIK